MSRITWTRIHRVFLNIRTNYNISILFYLSHTFYYVINTCCVYFRVRTYSKSWSIYSWATLRNNSCFFVSTLLRKNIKDYLQEKKKIIEANFNGKEMKFFFFQSSVFTRWLLSIVALPVAGRYDDLKFAYKYRKYVCRSITK